MSEKHIFNNKWLTEEEIRELCEKVGCSCPDDIMMQAANTPAAIRVFFEEIGRRKLKNMLLCKKHNGICEYCTDCINEDIDKTAEEAKEKIGILQKQLKEAKEELKEETEMQELSCEFADDSTKKLMDRIKELEKQFAESGQEEFKEFLEEIEKENPYPSDIFIEKTTEEWELFHRIMAQNKLLSEGYLGCFGRKVWNNCVEKLKENTVDIHEIF